VRADPVNRPPSSVPDVNLVILVGTCSRPVVVRRLPSGEEVAEVDLTTRADGPARSAPVRITAPATDVRGLGPGDEVTVVGSVRRRFFRSGGATATRVEVDACVVVVGRDRRRTRAALRRAVAPIEALIDPPKPGSP